MSVVKPPIEVADTVPKLDPSEEVTLKPAYWGSVIEAIPVAMSIHDRDGVIVLANNRLGMMYGMKAEEFSGRSCTELFHQEDQPCAHREVMANLEPKQMTVSRGNRSFRLSIEPIIGEDLTATGYVRSMTDVSTEQTAANEQFAAALISTLERMISAMAHDIGTPLGIVSGYSEYLLMKTAPGEPCHKELTTILQQTRRMSETIKQMVDLVRTPLDRIEAISLGPFLTEVSHLVRQELKKSGVAVTLTCDDPPPLIYGNSARLRQAFFNLILLACESIGQGGRLRLEIGEVTEREGSFTRVRLNGEGARGNPSDLGPAASALASADSYEAVLDPALSLTKDILLSSGARIRWAEGASAGASLVIDLPVRTPVSYRTSERPAL
ncbi:MAG TPA: PAS domain S-box protein [Blastocatellia bacterium]